MQHLLTPYATKRPPFAWWDGAFTEQELNWLQQKAAQSVEQGLAGGEIRPEMRRSEITWLDNTPESSWVFNKLAGIVSSLNAENFQFELTGFGEPLQLTHYHENKQGTYTWHQDLSSLAAARKLSLVLQLSDPSEYEGGELQLLVTKDPTKIQKKRGLVTVFPSWTLHQVTPVTKGTRQTLVTWVCGPEFK